MQTITALVGIPRLALAIIALAIIAFAPGLVAALPAGGKRAPAEHASAGPKGARLQITVRVYSYARLSRDTLTWTQRETELIFKFVGVGMTWVDCPLELGRRADYQGAYGPNEFVLRILPATKEMFARLTKEALGFALPCAPESTACLANVFSDRA